MPKLAARIWLEVLDVRVERVQDISMHDAIKEGIRPKHMEFKAVKDCEVLEPAPMTVAPIELFAELWDSINAKRGYSWESNCFVWVIEFKRIK